MLLEIGMKTYHLYKEKNSVSYYLVSYQRDEVKNYVESSIRKAIAVEKEAVTRTLRNYTEDPEFIGVMEDCPIGDEIFERKDGDFLNIWFSPNTLNSDFLVLGTAPTLEEFHEEAVEDYGDMVGPVSGHQKARVVYINAT